MLIGGLVKQSFIDYPGKMAAVIFTAGCNFRCGYCHNPNLVLPELIKKSSLITPENVLSYLQERKTWLEGVVITGGEPTIHTDLPEFIQIIKSLGYLVKLDTNGSNPSLLKEILVSGLIDYIAMDIKTILEPMPYAAICGINNNNQILDKIRKSIELIKQSEIDYEFRTTCIPGVHSKEMLTQIEANLGPVKKYTINEYREGITIKSVRIS